MKLYLARFFPYIVFSFVIFASAKGQDLDFNSIRGRINNLETRIEKLDSPSTLVEKKSATNLGAGQSGMKTAAEASPRKRSHGIAIGNHIVLNGYFHARFQSADHEKPSQSWFKTIDDYFTQDNYFTAFSELYMTLTLGNFDLNSRFYLSESGLGTRELYGQVNFDDTLRLKLGKLESNRAYSPYDLSQRLIRSYDYHYMEEGFGTSFSYALNDMIWQAMMKPFYQMISSSAKAIQGDIDARTMMDEFEASMNEYFALFGLTDEDLEALRDIETFKDSVKLEQEINNLMSKISASLLEMLKTNSILRGDYRRSYTKGLKLEKDFDSVSFHIAFRDSVWSTIPNFDEGQFGLDLGAVFKITPHLSLGTNYAFEKFEAPGGMMLFFIPEASDNIHHLNSYLEYENKSFTAVLEGDYYSINPLDSDAWSTMFLTQYRFKNGFALAFRYSHEDLSTPFGDGFSNRWTLSPSYRFNDYLMIRSELGTDKASLGTISDDLNYFFTLETLADF